MPDDELVVSDTSPFLNLSLIGRLDLLRDQFTTSTISEHVWSELAAGDEEIDGGASVSQGEHARMIAEFQLRVATSKVGVLTQNDSIGLRRVFRAARERHFRGRLPRRNSVALIELYQS